jgi:cysteine desulfurase
MYANNETGVIFDVPRISSILKAHNIIFHTDAVQAAGKIPIDVKRDGIDLLSISGHKMGAPKGIGVLYVKKGIRLTPLIHGGHHEFSLRAGTENVPSIVGLGMAAELSQKRLEKQSPRLGALRDRLESAIIEAIPDVSVNGKDASRIPNTTNISFHYIEGEGLLLSLDLEGIAVSSGSACTSGELKVSHVLSAMHIEAVLAQGSIRFSLGPESTDEDVDYVLSKLPPIVERLRFMSPLSPRS